MTYIGVESLTGDLENDLLRGVFRTAAVAVENLPNQFFINWNQGFWVATNFTEKRLIAPIRPGAKIVVGARELPPAGVTIWMDR